MITKLRTLILLFCAIQAEETTLIKPDGIILESTFDTEGHLVELNSSDWSISYSYAYDSLGHLVKTCDNIRGYSTERAYDNEGRLVEEKLPCGLIFKKSYDQEGKLSRLEIPDGSFVTYVYDDLYLRFIHRYDGQGRLLYTHSYTSYDPCGNLLSQELIENLGEVNFSFEEGGRRNKIFSPFFEQELDDALEIKQTEISFLYDINGNPVLSSDRTLYDYDALNRLISVERENKKIVFSYDAYHRLISKTLVSEESEETVFFLYDEEREIGLVDKLGNILELRILSPLALAEIEMGVAFELHGKVYAPLYDLFGNVAELVSADGSMENSPWRFCSKRFDSDAGLYYFGRRFYHPGAGKWLTPDPAGDRGDPNPYTYVRGDPDNYTDLYGLKSEKRTSFLKSCWQWAKGCKKKPSATYDLGLENESHIFFVNGINNSLEEARGSAWLISAMTPQLNVHGTHSASQGFLKDCFNYFKNFKNKHVAPVKVLKAQIDEYLREHPSQIILILCHSNGAVITRNALSKLDKELREQIDVIAIAPGAFIPENLCNSVHHYESTNDFVPLLDTKGRKKSKKNITTLEKHPDAPLFDHTFTSPTYKKVLEFVIDKHLKTLEGN